MEKNTEKITFKKFYAQRYLQAVALAGVLYILIFSYLPMFGIIIAFKNYRFEPGFWGIITSPWVGLKHFSEFYNDFVFWEVINNTLILSILKITFSFPVPIFLAIMFNEVRISKIKRIVQTISYLPYFISWTVVSAILFSFFNTQDGLVNQVLRNLNLVQSGIGFLFEPSYFRPMMVFSDIWKNSGWWTTIFLAAISGVDPTSYEAAIIDGAGRLQRIRYITFPSILGAVMVVLILNLGSLFGGGLGGSNFEQSYLLGNTVNKSVSLIIQTYSLDMGLRLGRYSYATAIGFAQSVISLFLIYGSNSISKKLTNTGIF